MDETGRGTYRILARNAEGRRLFVRSRRRRQGNIQNEFSRSEVGGNKLG
jgi:hypothetical protein